MNVRAQVPGHAPSQAGSQPRGLSLHGTSALPSQMQNPGAVGNMDPDMLVHRRLMCDNITRILHAKRPSAEFLQRLPNVVKRIEERLYRSAATKDDYLNMETLESRLHAIFKSNSSSQPPARLISSSSTVSTMIPTPGLMHNSGPNVTITNSLANSIANPRGCGTAATAAAIAGSLPNNRLQVAETVSAPLSGSHVSSMSVQQLSSQMIPTPGLYISPSMSMNTDCSSGIGRVSHVESTLLSQQSQQQKQHQQQQQQWHQLQGQSHQGKQSLENQNSGMLHGHVGTDLSSDAQSRSSSYRFSNGMVNGATAVVGKNTQNVGSPAASEAYMSTPYAAFPRPMQKHIDHQPPQPVISVSSTQQMNPASSIGNGISSAELSGYENLCVSAKAVGPTVSNPSMNPFTLHSKSKTYMLPGDQQNVQIMQQISHARPPCLDHSQKFNQHPELQCQQKMQKIQLQQQYPQQHSQSHEQDVQIQQQQKHIQLHHHVMKNDSLRQSLPDPEGQVTSVHGANACPERSAPKAPEHFQLSEFQSYYHPDRTCEGHSKQSLVNLSEQQDVSLTFSQGSKQMRRIANAHNEYSESQSHPPTSPPGSLSQGQLHPQALQKSQTMDFSPLDQHFQEDFHQRVSGQHEAQRPHFSLQGSITSHVMTASSVSAPQLNDGGGEPLKSLRERQYLNQQRWLLFLRHARCCPSPKGKCQEINCVTVQRLWSHMKTCKIDHCGYPRCRQSKALLKHHQTCNAGDCPVCVPVRVYSSKQHKLAVHTPDSNRANPLDACNRIVNGSGFDRSIQNKSPSTTEASGDLQSSLKRLKVDLSSSLIPKNESCSASVSPVNSSHFSQEVKTQAHQAVLIPSIAKVESVEVESKTLVPNLLESSQKLIHSSMDDSEDGFSSKNEIKPVTLIGNDNDPKMESMLIDGQTDQAATSVRQELHAQATDPLSGTKSGKPKIKGVSLVELFTPDQIREHIISLRQWVGQSKAKVEKNQAMEHSMSDNSCQLCAVEKLSFEPILIYCSTCGARIKRNATYYTIGMGDTRHYFCIPCYNEARGDSIKVEGVSYMKSKFEKKKNDEETEEWWVQCDKCEAWQHQICALFNGRRNDGEAEYTCPNCLVREIEQGERVPLPQSAVLGAKDLPRTILSDHIEQRLFKRLKQERQERARHLGKNVDEVPGAEALVVRVVSSVDKKVEVKQRFLDLFQEESYPTEFPYKSKVVLLFQKIEGVEVCLFGMYVQEFGSECQQPNQRRVYLSYLDSVKYFRPEIKTVTGEALRTFVYHEILIGYLEYCKKRGFTSCYIWACPPLKGEDYILYCHPEIQKTPKSDKLREWYLSMLRKATREDIVVELTNLYDHFFVQIGECKAKVTATRLPYFDGDYWPGAAEDMINQLQHEEDGRGQQKKGKTKKTMTKRSLKASCQTDPTSHVSKDFMLMHKLGETIFPMKEDFIMVHLQPACTHCCVLMVSGKQWICPQCQNFRICDKCYNIEQRHDDKERHPVGSREKHLLKSVEINDLPMDTKDKDDILESEFFDTRQAFLSLCQGNHYQFDTLRRAKHSSMMTLYHLHNPTEPAFVSTCNVCYRDVEAGKGWRCELCPDFEVCNNCYQRDGGVDHPHRLVNHLSSADRDQNKAARQNRVLQLRKMLDLLVHASMCHSVNCQYPNCCKVKRLFRHGRSCKIRASGGCPLCKKIWYILQLHARACKESECHVPRCRDLKEHLRRVQQQSDNRRRAAVMEMMRQRAAEVTGNGV